MEKRKRIALMSFVGMIFMFGLSRKTIMAGDCFCNTGIIAGTDNKTCYLNINHCNPGETATCQINEDGACNHGTFSGASCVCLASGEVSTQTEASFCVKSGHGPDSDEPQINTALGCIPIEMNKFMGWLLPWIFGVAGGIAFLLMIFGFIKMSTAKGDPKAVQGAKETIGSALTGLLVSVFSLFILRLLAVDILHIPGIN